MKKLLPLITLLFVAISVNASDYDFWLNFHNCKKLVSYLEFSDDSLQIQDGDSYVNVSEIGQLKKQW